MMRMCAYRDLFGAPGTGAHSVRFAGVAIVDVILTVLAGLLIAWTMGWPSWIVVTVLFVLGILIHRLFCVRTTVDKILFG